VGNDGVYHIACGQEVTPETEAFPGDFARIEHDSILLVIGDNDETSVIFKPSAILSDILSQNGRLIVLCRAVC
jgi:hypothetical protein